MNWRDRFAILFGAVSPFALGTGVQAQPPLEESAIGSERPAIDRDAWVYTDPADQRRYLNLASHSSHSSHSSHASHYSGSGSAGSDGTATPDDSSASSGGVEAVDPSVGAARFSRSETRDIIQQTQIALSIRGYDAGPTDGVLTPKTKSALSQYQAASALTVTGYMDVETLRRLGIIN